MFILSGKGAIHQQIYDAIRKAILTGELPASSRLPASRQLANDLSVSRNSVLLAFEHLLAEGYLETHQGSGTFVSTTLPEEVSPVSALQPHQSTAATTAEVPLSLQGEHLMATPSAQPKRQLLNGENLRYDFLYGSAEIDDLAHQAWRRLVTRHVREMPTRSLTYGSTLGFSPLRETIAKYLHRTRAVQCSPDQVMITTGSRQAIYLAAQLLLTSDDSVVLEDPHYIGAREIFAITGANLMGVQVDEQGLQTEALKQLETPAKLIYVTPSHQFPSGGIMPLERRLALLEWANDKGAYIIEDDYDCEYGYKTKPVEAVQAYDKTGRVIYIGTLSKVLFPALRLGYVVLPPQLVAPFTRMKWLLDRHTAIFEQKVLNDFIQEGHFERHLRRSRKRNTARRLALIKSLETYLGDKVEISGAHSGMHLLVWFKDLPLAKVADFVEAARKEDVGLYPITPYYFNPPEKSGFLFAFGTLTGHQIHEGIKRLSKLLG